MTRKNAITITGLEKSFDNGWGKRSTALKGLTLDVFEGEIFGYLGANGAGKTTTFKLMLGLIYPEKGEVRFWDRPASDYHNRSLVGYLPENPYFYSYLTAEESLKFYAGLFDLDRKTRNARIEGLLELVGLTHARKVQMRKFSRGMLQRIGIAQALINDPDLLILDEPMSGLDPMGRKDMRDIILGCRERGKTVVFSSHIISDVELICDRASILSKGELCHVIDMESILNTDVDTWELICQGSDIDLSGFSSQETVSKSVTGRRIILTTPDRATAMNLMDQIMAQGLDLVSFAPRRKSLEAIYIATTRKKDAAHG